MKPGKIPRRIIMEKNERLQKFISRCGVASRRKAEELIIEGRVKVNNLVITEMGVKIDPRYDKIKVDNKRIMPEGFEYILLNKPIGIISSVKDPEGRQTVLDIIPDMGARLYPVGRLDYMSEGLIILTNDGNLTQGLLHPKNEIPRIYEVKIKGHIKEASLTRIRAGMDLTEGKSLPAKVEVKEVLDKNIWLTIEVTEGKNRLVRRIFEKLGHDVLRLKRVQFGPLKLNELKPGKFQHLNQPEVDKLRKVAGVAKRPTSKSS
jgi:23S rRNA pseudouridine2605 synthase